MILESVKQIKNGQIENLVSLLGNDPTTKDLAETIDEIIYNFGTLKQPIFDRDRDGFSDKEIYHFLYPSLVRSYKTYSLKVRT